MLRTEEEIYNTNKEYLNIKEPDLILSKKDFFKTIGRKGKYWYGGSNDKIFEDIIVHHDGEWAVTHRLIFKYEDGNYYAMFYKDAASQCQDLTPLEYDESVKCYLVNLKSVKCWVINEGG